MISGAETELIARCRSGEAAAWDELFDRHYSAAGRFIFQLSPDFSREDVEEICQEVFLSVIRNLGAFHGSSQLQTWIFRIALNKSRDFIERRNAVKRGGGHIPIPLHSDDVEHGPLDPPAPNPSPDGDLLRAEDGALLRSALDRLGNPCREIIELRYFGDLSYEEIGRALRLNQKTVSSRLSKCLDRLEMLARPLFGRGKPKWEKTASSSV